MIQNLMLSIGIQSQYQWSCSSLDTSTNTYFIPDIHSEVTGGSAQRRDQGIASQSGDYSSSSSDLYLYQIPPALNCQGTVTALEFCYFTLNINLGAEVSVLRFYTMEVTGDTARITSTMDLSSELNSQKCTSVTTGSDVRNYCCETQSLDIGDYFLLPASNFAFGIRPFNPTGVGLLAFRSSSQIIAEYFVFDSATTLSLGVGDTLQLPQSASTRLALRLVNFVICK